MAAQIVDIADAIVAALKETSLSLKFDICRRILPVFDLKTEGLQLVVVPGGGQWSLLTRGSLSEDDKVIDIGVFKKLNYPAEAPNFEVDGPTLLAFMDSLVAWLKAHRKHAGFSIMTIENDVIYDVGKLREDHCFLTVLKMSFKGGSA